MTQAVQMQIAFISILVGIAIFFIFVGIRQLRQERNVRLSDLVSSYGVAMRARDLELRQPFHERIVRPTIQRIVRRASRLAPSSNVVKIQEKLMMAGEPWNLSPMDFVGLRILAASLGAALAAIITINARMPFLSVVMFSVAGLLIGFLLPNMWLNRLIRARQKAIRKALPDVLDMLTICVNAGLGFDAAVARVVEKWNNPLTEELERVLYEMRMGLPRAEALRNLADRTGVPELSSFVAIIIQAERLGASIADTLQAQAKTMREQRRQWAEEQARKAPIKMLIPLVLFVFPSLFVVILGPAIPRIMRTFGR